MSKRRIVVSIFGGLLFATMATVVMYKVRLEAFKMNYSKLQAGESKQLLVDRLGNPSEIVLCDNPRESKGLARPCWIKFYYYSFMEQWVVYLDQNLKVIDKSYSVSPWSPLAFFLVWRSRDSFYLGRARHFLERAKEFPDRARPLQLRAKEFPELATHYPDRAEQFLTRAKAYPGGFLVENGRIFWKISLFLPINPK